MINFTFTTKTNETFTFESASFSFRLWAEAAENGSRWFFQGPSYLKGGIDPFLYKIAAIYGVDFSSG
jgi:hypothetical protein